MQGRESDLPFISDQLVRRSHLYFPQCLVICSIARACVVRRATCGDVSRGYTKVVQMQPYACNGASG
jgi:hypothetical protein